MNRNRLALAALLVGIGSLINLFGLEKGILAVVIGVMALNEAKSNAEGKGKGFAWTGIILGSLSIILIIGLLVFKGPELIRFFQQMPRIMGR